ncbi:hypothetical protein C8N26_1770 [Tenacibaculum lutimaris]|uniref:Uncharacterized protein n=1 Tax=Tenacibaculum lutimaris TaxID=285258 RepID=A0A420DZV5_9FLAO|nr:MULTISPECIES: hypothetical protein [Tenacibaculum]RKF03385.1 hypothetical protein C8N26_1770 [Tenacibaculum lutimaris]
MNTINWNDLAQQATLQTDKEFNQQLAILTNLNPTKINDITKECKITNTNIVKTLKLVDDATMSTNEKAKAISNIENGFGFLISLASKVI